MVKPQAPTAQKFRVGNGESYVFEAEDFGVEGVKILLEDPRDLDLLDKDRIHAVILPPESLSAFRRWLATCTMYLPEVK